jgi:hypothetical protein
MVLHDFLCNLIGLDAVMAALNISSQRNNHCLSDLQGLCKDLTGLLNFP